MEHWMQPEYFAWDDYVDGSIWDNSVPRRLSRLSKKLPGVFDCVKWPCCNPGEGRLYEIIQHLNDAHKWSQPEIADWLDQQHH